MSRDIKLVGATAAAAAGDDGDGDADGGMELVRCFVFTLPHFLLFFCHLQIKCCRQIGYAFVLHIE